MPGLAQLKSKYIAESAIGMEELDNILGNEDVLVVHDPQPLGAAARLLDRRPLPAIWRCHIGYPGRTPTVDHTWGMLTNFLQPFQLVVLSDEAYAFESPVPISFIQPSICPFSRKNRAYNAPPNRELLEKVKIFNGSEQSVIDTAAVLDSRYFLHVSRWDSLKGIDRVIDAFVEFCRSLQHDAFEANDHIRLVVAGPDPDSVADDPEGLAYFEHCQSICDALSAHIRKRIDLTCISMENYNLNAEVVGRLQQNALGVFQMSRQEGFGLTSTEALFRARPLVVSSAFGLQLQVTDGENGTVLSDPDIHIKASKIMHRIADGSDEIERMAQIGRGT